ncbi:hypothetical protein M3Y97_00545400 [Aphelenchoides bicaudatus]|nr:hypothetical protein M3Y97_00545400 [Aphelenchoides bicaudatus]
MQQPSASATKLKKRSADVLPGRWIYPRIHQSLEFSCQKVPVASRKDGTCSVTDPLSCDAQKSEVCLFADGRYKCDCPKDYGRLADGRCLLINECNFPKLNTCPASSDCVDRDVGFECRCKSGLIDLDPASPGRRCGMKLQECDDPEKHKVDCSENAKCVETDASYECRCLPGFVDLSTKYSLMPGRKCVEIVNECEDSTLHDCSAQASCTDEEDGYSCKCNAGFTDASPNLKLYPGRICNKPSNISLPPTTFPKMDDLCDPNSQRACRPNEVCLDKDLDGNFRCECSDMAFRFRDGSCRLKFACETQKECSPNANCISQFDSFSCKCRDGFFDASPDLELKPGRICNKLINECATSTHNCGENSKCEDKLDGFTCTCLNGYTDSSANYGLAPGRICTIKTNECLDQRLNTCDENADCLDTNDGYNCLCYPGYIDVSSSANLPAGRVCTIATSCTKQKTDLMFLVDGSGSIGENVFGDEILRFISEFIDLFDVSPDQTRVALIQYSDQIRHEFDFGEHTTKQALKSAILKTEYLTGLTRTGAAIKHMANEGFTERRGARPQHSKDVSRVAIIVTDGRSQDNVTIPSRDAQTFSNINIFAIGVTDHVLLSELETIAGSSSRWFFVDRFKDLDTRLRSLIQKIACPAQVQQASTSKCEVGTQRGCNRALNEICVLSNGQPRCVCPPLFERHPLTGTCGHPECNPDLPTSCPVREVCARTPFGRYRCVCQEGYRRDTKNGLCLSKSLVQPFYTCATGTELNPRTGKCIQIGSCDPQDSEACDMRKNEKCLLHPNGQSHICRCEGFQRRHPITDICLANECQGGNDCDSNAVCIDTDTSYLCACRPNFIDRSPEPNTKPGRKCEQPKDECLTHQNLCSVNAICIDTFDGYECRCKAGYIDLSQNGTSGRVCHMQINECAQKDLNDCHPDAVCKDTRDSFTCQCKTSFADIDELRQPGRNCIKGNINECRSPMLNRCSPNAVCIDESNGYRCECKNNFIDKSPFGSLGFICEEPKHACQEPELNDCHFNSTCIPNGPDFNCKCLDGFADVSTDKSRPGRSCIREVAICNDPNRNDCHPKATCLSLNGSAAYNCSCNSGYLDKSPTKSRPGRVCVELINECLVENFNDCDKNALCEDLQEGFLCRCPKGSIDESPDKVNKPGRVCRPTINECENSKLHSCSRFATCLDQLDGYTCRCNKGFYDDSPNPKEPGRVCAVFNEDFKATSSPLTQANEMQCGKDVCFTNLNEVCVDGTHCECRPKTTRQTSKDRCEEVQRTPLSVRILSNGDHLLRYSSQYNNPKNVPYIEFAEDFKKQMFNLFKSTVYAPKYVTSDVVAITHPKTVNSTWSEGLLVNFSVATKESQALTDKCELFDAFFETALKNQSRSVENGQLKIAPDSFFLNPCPTPPNYCAGSFCQTDLGEVCLRGKCVINYCSDVQFCPTNTTCNNLANKASCECNPGFVDIRESQNRKFVGLANDVWCLRAQDVDECALGLHNCSAIAQCTNRRIGFECSCPKGYIDGNTNDPGKICAALLCDMCNQHGDCVPNKSGQIVCECTGGYSGEFCQFAPSDLPYILLILLALIFLFLTLCCLLYAFSKCRCFKQVAPWSALNQTHSTGFSDNTSDLYAMAIPRAKLKAFDTTSINSGASDFTIRENGERQVITEITRVEYHDDGNNHPAGGTFNAYHSINDYGDSEHPYRHIEHHETFVANEPNPDYGQDDRSIDSYHSEHRVYENGPEGGREFRSESRNRR